MKNLLITLKNQYLDEAKFYHISYFFKHPFGISRSSNNWYDIVLLFLQDGNIIGRGEAAPSIRYKESTEKILSVLNRGVNIPQSENMTLEKMQNFIYPQLENIKSLQGSF